jgi:hypothetical protein
MPNISRKDFAKALEAAGGRLNKIDPKMFETVEPKPEPPPGRETKKLNFWQIMLFPFVFVLIVLAIVLRGLTMKVS